MLICCSIKVRLCRTALSHPDISANLDAVRAGVVDETSVITALSRLAAIYIYMGWGYPSSSGTIALHMHAAQDAHVPAHASTVQSPINFTWAR